ncbi:uncharacterized protein BO95DRAFT_136915 [Aspergillus brunneoviolaceus CBS 621.78]|uniref:Uncharacterized protein n=1 Tax=Aspergillus brunneoviolaceus CBS 621.78 TaxID=1450534 RepID=A0ACD1G8W4_9EURO|nr:hypothetical protein BO95DRAFT_136915 [Aspergillus brunneoviolaceus CBS 621.78]RAH45603.1 hypothetical protein BO95DRAFT_136915 [Aspergillus brunneoviolaceus CBS 621.78]
MPLRDKLQRHKESLSANTNTNTSTSTNQYGSTTAGGGMMAPTTPVNSSNPTVPQFTFIRTDTTTQEVIRPPVFEGDAPDPSAPTTTTTTEQQLAAASPPSSHHRKSLNPFRRSRAPSQSSGVTSPPRARGEGRLSHLLHLDRGGGSGGGGGGGWSRSSSSSSVNVPPDLPRIITSGGKGDGDAAAAAGEDVEAEWERRATVLVQRNPQFAACLSPTGSTTPTGFGMDGAVASRSRSSSCSRINDPDGDVSFLPVWVGG